MPSKLRSKIILESQGSRFDVIETVEEGTVLSMLEQLEKDLASRQPIQNEDVSDNPIGQEGVGCTCNIDVPIHFSNSNCDFQALIEELKS